MKSELEHRKLPKGFWRLIAIAVVVGNVGLLALLWLGVPSWLAVAVPTAAVGIGGIVLEYRQRAAK